MKFPVLWLSFVSVWMGGYSRSTSAEELPKLQPAQTNNSDLKKNEGVHLDVKPDHLPFHAVPSYVRTIA